MKFMLKGTLLRGCCSQCIAYGPVRDVDGDLMCEPCERAYYGDGVEPLRGLDKESGHLPLADND